MRRATALRVLTVLAAVSIGGAVLPSVVPGTSGAYLARVTNSANSTATATRFLCRDSFTATANRTNAYFEYQFTGNGTTAVDSSNAGNGGVFQGSHATEPVSTASACPNDNSSANQTGQYTYTPNGSSQWVSTNKPVSTTPTTFSLAIWFRTTVAGGYLMGLNGGQTSDGSPYDRHVYLDTSGRLAFGTYSGGYQMVTSPASYNDGRWHQVVATMSPTSGMTLWVDGVSVASNAAYTSAEANTGYWRIGYGPLTGWPNAPATTYFSGALRFAAAYSIQLSQEEIQAEYRNGKPLS